MWHSVILNARAGRITYAAPPGLRALLTRNQWLAPLAKLCRRSAASDFTKSSDSRDDEIDDGTMCQRAEIDDNANH
jgi:hypothetical protein